MTEFEVREAVKQHNNAIDKYINEDLAKELNAVDGMIPMADWFKAQSLIKEQRFYEKGKAIMDRARGCGFDVKMDMQSDKLVY